MNTFTKIAMSLLFLAPTISWCQDATSILDATPPPISINPSDIPEIKIPEVYLRWNPKSLDDEITCLAKNIYFESYKEPDEGQLAVGLVTINRLIEGGWKNTICGIVYQKGRIRIHHRLRTVAQFSWTTKRYARRTPSNTEAYQHDLELARMLLANGSLFNVPDITDGATYYHASYVHRLDKGWKDLDRVVRIGMHIFFRDRPEGDSIIDYN